MGFKLSKIFDIFKDKTPKTVKMGRELLEELRRPTNDFGFYSGGDISSPIPFNRGKVRSLIADGADLTVTDFVGSTALCLAITKKGLESVAQDLVDSGSDVNHVTSLGQTPLMLAAKHGLGNIVKGLLEKKADPAAETPEGNTALHYAAEAGCTDAAKRLIAEGADIDKQGKWGHTPLMNAVERGHYDTVVFLIESGAKRNIQNERGRTIYDMLWSQNDSRMTVYFEELAKKDAVIATEMQVAVQLSERQRLEACLKEGAPLKDSLKTAPSIRFKPKEPKS